MMAAVPKLLDAVTHYASHCLCANVHFSDIEKIMLSIKTDQSIIYMIPYHKPKNCIRDIARDRLIIVVKKA